MAKKYQAPRGTYDVVPADAGKWRFVEDTFSRIAGLYGYQEMRTPTFEDTDLFVRSSGDTSEVVTKQMYSFVDKGERNITLRPELTAPAMRAYLEHSLGQPGQVTRLWYCGSIFRYERPQKGRCREAHQVGVELIGSASPMADAEVIDLTVQFYQGLGLASVEVLLNCIGRGETRSKYSDALIRHVASWLSGQSSEDQARAQKNPLRLLDTKDENLKSVLAGAPSIHNFLEDTSKAHFDAVQSRLTEIGVPYHVQDDIVRGLDYYTDTVFEVHGVGLGAQSALCGGGRYDNLIKELGGHDTPSVGVAMGVERALIAMEAADVDVPSNRLDVFVVSDNEENWKRCLQVAKALRGFGLSTQTTLSFEKLPKQIKEADRSGALLALIVGSREVTERFLTGKEMATREETRFDLDGAVSERIVEYVHKRRKLINFPLQATGQGNIDPKSAIGNQQVLTIEQIL